MNDSDRALDAALRDRLGADYLGWTGERYAAEIGGGFVERPRGAALRFYVLHHTAGAQTDTGAELWRYHTRHLGWSTAGYHLVIRRGGQVEMLIPPSLMSYGAGPTWNASTVHVVVPGNYATVHEPESAPLDTIYRVFCTLDDTLGGRPWRGHKELKATACPGRLQAHLERMRGPRYGAASLIGRDRPAHYP